MLTYVPFSTWYWWLIRACEVKYSTALGRDNNKTTFSRTLLSVFLAYSARYFPLLFPVAALHWNQIAWHDCRTSSSLRLPRINGFVLTRWVSRHLGRVQIHQQIDSNATSKNVFTENCQDEFHILFKDGSHKPCRGFWIGPPQRLSNPS